MKQVVLLIRIVTRLEMGMVVNTTEDDDGGIRIATQN